MIRYVKNYNGIYVKPFYKREIFGFIVALFVYLCILLLECFGFNELGFLLNVVLFGILIVGFLGILIDIKRCKGILKYFESKILIFRITRNLISTMNVDIMKDTRFINVPKVSVTISESNIEVYVERLANMNDIVKIKSDVSVSFVGKFKDYAVVDYFEYDNYSCFKFFLENVNLDKRIYPFSIEDIRVNGLYKVVIQNDVVWDMDKSPHMIISGKTGSSKSTFLMSLILQYLDKGIDVRIIDVKKSLDLYFLNIANDSESAIGMLKDFVDDMEKREKEVSEFNRTHRKMGLTACDLGLKPVILVIDELSALVASFDSKVKKEFDSLMVRIVQRGRSSGYFLITAMQNANSETIKVAIRNQFAMRVLLGNSTKEDIKFIFGENNETVLSTVEKYTGYYTIDGFTNVPRKLYVTDIYKYGLNDIDIFEKCFNKRSG